MLTIVDKALIETIQVTKTIYVPEMWQVFSVPGLWSYEFQSAVGKRYGYLATETHDEGL